ncbi:uncharacterized protein LOC110344805 isoform X2 [Heterocephalus glaber]|uniref:Uncharacterized protein LOC110344805 isoform X2 n=1 Tax=Heterocephalus glaber TaxID=10181 RepID=A0AAX6RIS2_HETGA|nr:uncharacterized protein LOC110344805 isoform X2 [Heterocephalus glaber]XP_021095743.1 uncharacterized protein LOC110344805 isoform X2 [Heterocephalus glaber]
MVILLPQPPEGWYYKCAPPHSSWPLGRGLNCAVYRGSPSSRILWRPAEDRLCSRSGPSLLSGGHQGTPAYSATSGASQFGCHGDNGATLLPSVLPAASVWAPGPQRSGTSHQVLWLLSLPSLSIWLPLSPRAETTMGCSQAWGREVRHHLLMEHSSPRLEGKTGAADGFPAGRTLERQRGEAGSRPGEGAEPWLGLVRVGPLTLRKFTSPQVMQRIPRAPAPGLGAERSSEPLSIFSGSLGSDGTSLPGSKPCWEKNAAPKSVDSLQVGIFLENLFSTPKFIDIYFLPLLCPCTFFVVCLFLFLFLRESHYVAQAGLELKVILLPLPPEYWDDRAVPPCLAVLVCFNIKIMLAITYPWKKPAALGRQG